MLIQCCFYVGLASQTLAQHETSTGPLLGWYSSSMPQLFTILFHLWLHIFLLDRILLIQYLILGYVHPVLVSRWALVADVGPTRIVPCFNASYLQYCFDFILGHKLYVEAHLTKHLHVTRPYLDFLLFPLEKLRFILAFLMLIRCSVNWVSGIGLFGRLFQSIITVTYKMEVLTVYWRFWLSLKYASSRYR